MRLDSGIVRPRWDILIDLIMTYRLRNIAEIGVDYGDTAIHIVEKCVDIFKNYYMIDPVKRSNVDGILADPRCHFIQKVSEEAVNDIADDSLDLVFIDAKHDYEYVKKDITIWIPKLRKSGFMSGHDFCDAHPGVIRAVNEIIKSPRLEIDAERVVEHCDAVWWIRKDEIR